MARSFQNVSYVPCFIMSVQPGDWPWKYFSSAFASDPMSRNNWYPSFVLRSVRPPHVMDGPVPMRPHEDMKLNVDARKNAPLWWVSSPRNQSVCGACGETALSAG